ncbi:MAG: UDP-N-acetylmuramoyl-tripeptide--D-alanyl-D-alanine ligase [Paracoccus sp. (in: a-proteobacteria)]|uniref:UDP-N-acetylmuramoyl-tripeptide--D-alanyl-D- alanine ligase n=1 Tax=Paracoccus sp. TaxID=267 RepID=UPI0026DF38BD|nr:UDP-N-acetylmuramoyl-tripeptide--D-alanyl-D-alanine ligase [Paracoccus sp. (in: a-proteobacteria)]MDO5620140.1 UDP-N-acetylmuramoyl-tripeptide--D-alanyl-D-alanine ligase [Paracoccus sp. (in: a-proteobacteria)]
MALWTASDAAAATGGRVTADWQANGISIDTRTIAPGDLFVALKAARDGHDFVAQALACGAAAALVSRIPEGVAPDAPLLVVPDVLAGLEALARAARVRTRARIAAVTGSVGKTSTKEMLRAALTPLGRTHAAEASYNNHWGVPLTLARMPADTDFAIIEIGMNHPGEIAPLTRLARPHAAMITTVAAAHIEAFDSIDGIAREKAAVFQGLEPGGAAVIPAGLPTTPILLDAAHALRANVTTFGPDADVALLDVTPDGAMTRATIRVEGQDLTLRLASAGTHFAMNAAGVLAMARPLGLDPAALLPGLEAWTPPAGRGRVQRIAWGAGHIDVIDDAYNANPTSLGAGLQTLSRLPGQRRVAILGDMLELGADAAEQHAAMAAHPAMAAVDLVHTAGPLMRHLAQALPDARRGQVTESAEDLATQAAMLVQSGDIVLIKGSKSSRITKLVDALRQAGNSSATQEQE